MPFQWEERAEQLLRNPASFKILATNDRHGNPHVVVDHTIALDQSGNILYLELLESSESNSNLINSLWFKREAALYITDGAEHYQIKGVPVRSIVNGPVFEHYYRQVLALDPDNDLSTVWIIEPRSVTNEEYGYKRRQERENHPLTLHLDRLAKQEQEQHIL